MDKIPTGKIQIRKLDRNKGDVVEVVNIENALVKIEDTELIIDEDTNTLIDRSELEGKLEKGEVKKIRTMPVIAGGCIWGVC